MHSTNPDSARSEIPNKAVLWMCMAGWAISFFLPALRTNGFFLQEKQLGFEAFLSSVMGFFVPVYGWVWPANIFMALAPIFARSFSRGKNIRVYVFLLCAWTALTLGVPIYQSLDYRHEIIQLRSGFYLWQLSLLGTATCFLWMLYRRPVLLVATSLITVVSLFGSAGVAPEYIARRDLRRAVRNAENRIADFERTGNPASLSVPAWELTKFVDASHAGMRDLQLATGYMNDIYTLRQREHISDSTLIDRYPEVPVRFSDATHTLPALINTKDGNGHTDDGAQPWMDYRDLRPAALKRAKLYLRNAGIELGMTHGQRQLPELLGSADLVGQSPFAKRDMPARFSNIENLVQVQRAGTQGSIRADNNISLGKHDTVVTGTSSAAIIVFADKTACTIESGSQIMVEENSINASGRTIVKVELVNGKIALHSGMRIYRSSSQVEFVMVQGTVDLGAESSIEVQSDSRTSIGQVLLRKGSAEVRLLGEAPVQLLERERFTFANNGLRSKTSETAHLVRSRGSR